MLSLKAASKRKEGFKNSITAKKQAQ